MEILRTSSLRLMWDGNKICALIGQDLSSGVGGFGDTVQEALRDLATQIETLSDEITIWVPRPAVQYRENGVLKAACPECGAIKEFAGFDKVIAYICSACGSANYVQGSAQETP